MSIEAMKQALEALDWRFSNADAAIEALRQAIEQAEKQEPVAWMFEGNELIKVYAASPKREWVGLTEKEIFEADNAGQGLIEFARAIETKLKERNT